jgi:hypothetical protein
VASGKVYLSFRVKKATTKKHVTIFELGRQGRPGRQTGICLYRQKGKQNPGDTGSQPKQLHIRGDNKTTNKHLPVLDPMVFLNIF